MNSIYLGNLKSHGKSLSLFKKSILSVLFLVGSFVTAQQSVGGTVVDPAGVPLPGVNVVIKGTDTGTSSDFDGNFTIEASDTDVLIFFFCRF
jgi:iron complex outermembrane receptor protein